MTNKNGNCININRLADAAEIWLDGEAHSGLVILADEDTDNTLGIVSIDPKTLTSLLVQMAESTPSLVISMADAVSRIMAKEAQIDWKKDVEELRREVESAGEENPECPECCDCYE